MRIINLIVVHCSATRGIVHSLRKIWTGCTDDVDSTEQVITTTSARMEQCTSPAPSNASEHMQKVSTLTQ